VIVGNEIDAEPGRQDGDAHSIREAPEFSLRPREPDAVSREKDGASRALEDRDSARDELARRRARSGWRWRLEGSQRLGIDHRGLHVERNLDPDRSRTARPCQMSGFLEMKTDVLRVHHGYGVLRDGRDQ
jgi:hypothetical protein